MQTGRQTATNRGDGEAMIMRRFTRSEHDQGGTAGWHLDAGWFRRASGLEWGWFRKDDDST